MRLYFILQILLTFCILSNAQVDGNPLKNRRHTVKMVFYNVENLFDIWDDPETNDDEFLPWGIKNWTYERLHSKLNHTSKVLIGLGKWNVPAIIGLCEIENRYILNQLVENSPLASWPYAILHYESPDHRGIDVALLYLSTQFEIISSEAVTANFDVDTSLKTRDILYAKGVLDKVDTLHLFINHWPSRYGDYAYTSLKRLNAAGTLHDKIDSIQRTTWEPKIIIMGDFNDEPGDESLRVLNKRDLSLINLMKNIKAEGQEGTIKYQSQWYFFDQIIISSNLRDRCRAFIYKPDFLFMKDEKYFGRKPFRTYSGPKYLGGYSDHLPVYLELELEN